MNFYDDLTPQNTPESDPFISVITGSTTANMDSLDANNFPGHPSTSSNNNIVPPPSFDNNWPMDDQEFSDNDHTYLWSQDHHFVTDSTPVMPESGFISGSTTQPPSQTGHDEDMEGNFVCGGEGSITGSSIYNLNSVPHSGTLLIHIALSAEYLSDQSFDQMVTIAETSSIHSASTDCADPLISIPNLIDGLQDEDELVRHQYLSQMDKFSRKEQFLSVSFPTDERLPVITSCPNI